MRILIAATVVAGLIGLGTALAPCLTADEANQLTTVTFSEPVEIPGQVLPAGMYVFKVLDPEDPNIVQIFNKDQSKLYATILAIPDYRLKPTGKTVIPFGERAAGSPEAVQAWFYPGMDYGHEFVYPEHRAVELAKVTNKPVPSMPNNLEANTKMPTKSSHEPNVTALKKAPVKAVQPSGAEVEIAQVFTPPPASSGTAPGNPAPAKKLPATASPLPLIGLAGLVLVGSGLSLRVAAAKLVRVHRSDV
jgi:hypothetical protein